MKDIVIVAKKRAERFHVKNVVVATNRGASARYVREVFGPNYQIFAVGNPGSAAERRLVYHAGVDEGTRKSLECQGIKVILLDQGLFQAAAIGGQPYDLGEEVPAGIWRGSHKMPPEDQIGRITLSKVVKKALEGKINALAIIGHTIGSLLGDGPAVCIEVTVMAADSGLLPLNEDCIAIARPKNVHTPHAVLVLHPAKARDFFDIRVKDMVIVPQEKDHWFKDKPLWPADRDHR